MTTTVNERVIHQTKQGVRLYAPTETKPYYRLRYRDEDGRKREPSAGRDLAKATAKAKAIDEHLASRLADPSGRTMGDVIEPWLADMSEDWASSHTDKQGVMVRRFLRPGLADLPAWELTRAQVEECLRTPTASSMKIQLRAAMGSLLNWAYSQATPMLPQPKTFYMPSQRRKTAKNSAAVTTEHGSAAQYIQPIYIPDAHDARLLAEALRFVVGLGVEEECGGIAYASPKGALTGWLIPAMAASCGLRPGELYGLTVGQLTFAGPGSYIYVDGQLPAGRKVTYDENGRPERQPPKWGRNRTSPLPPVTVWGEDLHGPLKALIHGKGPEDLVFTTSTGKPIQDSNFKYRMWKLARQRVPGWNVKWTLHSLRHSFCTLYMRGDESLGRKPVDIIDISLFAGHRDVATTQKMYISPTKGVLERFAAAFSSGS